MNIIIDSDMYTLDAEKAILYAKTRYDNTKDNEIIFSIGTMKIDVTKKSVLRTGIKTLLMPMFVHMLKDMYEKKHLVFPEREKKGDLIDFFFMALFEYLLYAQKDFNIYASTEIMEDGTAIIRNIKRISTFSNTSRKLSEGDRTTAKEDQETSGTGG